MQLRAVHRKRRKELDTGNVNSPQMSHDECERRSPIKYSSTSYYIMYGKK